MSSQRYEFDQQFRGRAPRLLCGVDEAGRGPMAGPVCAAAVILPPEFDQADIRDSKKLSATRREELAAIIQEQALAWDVATIDARQIDRINILTATREAMRMAIERLPMVPELILADGMQPDFTRIAPGERLVGGDNLSLCIGAASILAKVHRDALMKRYSIQYPGYGFARHKGYGTREHLQAIRRMGPCPIHRMSFGALREYRREEGET